MTSKPVSPHSVYELALAKGFQADSAQRVAVDVLEACYRALHAGERAVGVYLWGPVGRGKTWLMDSFHQSLAVAARRQHFHHFMRWVHRRLFQLTGTPAPLDVLAAELAREIRVLCLDEFFVSDIGDAMLLGPLVQQLFSEGVVVVATSNQPPEQLYADGFHRDRFLPAIEAIKARMQVVAVDGGADHRLHPGPRVQRYWVQSESQPSPFPTLARELGAGEPYTTALMLGSHRLELVRYDDRVLWCTYDQLCEAPLAANDYIQLCDRFDHILVSGIPCLAGVQREVSIARGTEDAAARVETGDRTLPRQSKRDNGVRRFIALVDECYDRRIPLWLEAEVAVDDLYPDGYLAFAFRRTLSRLKEMQFTRFGVNARRSWRTD